LSEVSRTVVERRERSAGGRTFVELSLSSVSGVNPLSSATVAEIREAMRVTAADGQVHGLFIAAQGRSFCAGADVKEFRGFGIEDFRGYMTNILAMYMEMTRFPKPIVSLVHADALGGGAALAFFSDIVISVRSARFALPEVHRGLAGGGYLMPRLLGKQLAAEWVLLGRSFSAEDAHRTGLVNVVCEADELEAHAERFAAEFAALSAAGLAAAKQSLGAGLTMDLQAAMDAHVVVQTEAFAQAQAAAA
jgi:2-(1,2-epoxy-1,2-dihydrophenyl)acetyl-CoA isomerase